MTKSPYDLEKLLSLLEERERVLSKIQTFELPQFIISNEANIPAFRISFSRFGDLLIQKNVNISTSSIGYNYSDVGEIVADLESDIADCYYIKALGQSKSSVSSRLGRLTRRDPVDGMVEQDRDVPVQWSLVLAIPLMKCMELSQALFNLFKDDFSNNSQ